MWITSESNRRITSLQAIKERAKVGKRCNIIYYSCNSEKNNNILQINHPKGIKCGTFGACLVNRTDFAFGDFGGELNIVDLETGKIFYSVKAHEALVNCIDGIGGLDVGNGAPEIVTGGRDGKFKFIFKK